MPRLAALPPAFVARFVAKFVAASAAAFAAALSASAAPAAEPQARLELLPGWMGGDGVRRAGLGVALEPGWKTYWRHPGEAGIAPRLDWSGSKNVAAVEVVWPRPEAFEVSGFLSFGWRDGVVLPLLVTPEDPARSVTLRLAAELGVCDEVCLLTLEEASLRVPPEAEGGRALVAAALSLRPEDGLAAGAATLRCGVIGAGANRRFEALLSSPRAFAAPPAAAVEGPEGVWFGRAEVSEADGALLVTAPVSVRPAERWIAREALRLTLIGEGRAVEIAGCGAGAAPG